MSPEQVSLHYRLSEALGSHDVHPEIRGQIQDAYLASDGTWDGLPAETRAQIEEVETLPPQSWSDPADVPDNLDD
jgi:hypothetical protein